MRRAVSVTQLHSEKWVEYDLKGQWFESFGKPERSNVWFVMAEVASGKTTFVAMLCKELSQFGIVAYNSIEEGKSKSLSKAFKRAGIKSGSRKVIVLNKEYFTELCARLDKHKSPQIVVIDTIQHSWFTRAQYTELKERYPNKTFVIISHMDGKKPEGSVAKFIYQDAGIKITIRGFVAFVKSRYVDGMPKPFVIWEKGAIDFHGFDFINKFKAA
ncbi:MAG: ATP-binding protein [Bacteroidia bacterium]|nr:ATP-binding protein [Bacteroidia bacterium]